MDFRICTAELLRYLPDVVKAESLEEGLAGSQVRKSDSPFPFAVLIFDCEEVTSSSLGLGSSLLKQGTTAPESTGESILHTAMEAPFDIFGDILHELKFKIRKFF